MLHRVSEDNSRIRKCPCRSCNFRRGKEPDNIANCGSSQIITPAPNSDKKGMIKLMKVQEAVKCILDGIFRRSKRRKANEGNTRFEVGREPMEQKVIPQKWYPVFFNTVEGCCLYSADRDTYGAVKEVFNSLPNDMAHRLEFAPKDGEYIDRVRFWQRTLSPMLPAEQYRIAISAIIDWYIHIKRDLREV